MSIIIDYFVALVLIFSILAISLKSIRNSLIALLIFSSLMLPVFPWDLIPYENASIVFQLSIFVAIGIWSIIRFIHGKALVINSYSFWLIILQLVLILYLVNSTNFEYGLEKTLFMLVKSLIPVLLINVFLPISKKDLKLIIMTVLISAILFSYRVIGILGTNSGRLSLDLDIGSISVARILGVGATVIIYFVLNNYKSKNNLFMIALVGQLGLFLLLMPLTGSRGPILFVFLSIIPIYFVDEKRLKRKIILSLKVSVSIIALLVLLVIIRNNFNLGSGIDRVLSSIPFIGDSSGISDVENSNEARINMIEVSVENIISSKGLGIGTGSFGNLYYDEYSKVSNYPHNIIVEIALELGLVGLIIFGYIILKASKSLYLVLKNPRFGTLEAAIGALFLFYFINSMVSGDIAKNFPVWILIAIIFGISNSSKIPEPNEECNRKGEL